MGRHTVKSAQHLAIAVDIGTTTLAASLIDRATERRLAFCVKANPQRSCGTDVISRLHAAGTSEDAFRSLCSSLNQAIEEMAAELLYSGRGDWKDISCIALAGNPAMEHFALGLPVDTLAFLPFRPLFTEGQKASTLRLGWKQDLDAYFFPLPGGFVGGDLIAFLYGVSQKEPYTSSHTPSCADTLYLDLGTNGEIALETGNTVWATSAAAGPAFEGGNLSCGMPALPGAIDRVSLDRDRISTTTISGAAPAGICGSGVLSALSGMLDSGLLDVTGRIRHPREIDSNLANRIEDLGSTRAMVISRDARRTTYLSQEDIRQVQLAKAAIRAGMEVLFQRAGIAARQVQKVVLTGSFGAVLDPQWLKSIGIFTENMVNNGVFIREGALCGAERSLMDPQGFEAIEELARRVRVIPLSGSPVFEKHFLEQMNFPAVHPST